MLSLRFRDYGVACASMLALAWGCGNDVMYQPSSGSGGTAATTGTTGTTGTTSTTATTGPGGASPDSKEPPAPPMGAPKGDGPGVVLAWSKIFLGDTNKNGSPKPNAWQDFGYNLDGKVSTATSTDHCKPRAGANPKAVKEDGKGGVDNAWGKLLVPIFTSISAELGAKLNDALATGKGTTLVRIDAIGAAADYLGLPAALYTGRSLGHAPFFNGSDKWPVAVESLANPNDVNSALAKFASSYLSANTWVSGAPAAFDVPLVLSLAGAPMTLPIHRPILTMEIAADRKSAKNGILAGIIPVESMIAELKKTVGSFSKDLCSGNTFDSLAENIRQAADIGADGAQDPNKSCDAISIGVGFEAKIVQLGAIAPAQPPPPDPCQ